MENESSKSGGTGGGSELTGGYRSNPLDSPASESSQANTVIMHGDKVLSDGRPTEKLSIEEAKSELRRIEAPDSPLFGDEMPYWERQKLERRRTALYERTAPDPVVAKAEREKRAKESIDKDMERFAERDAKALEKKLEERLVRHFGSEKEADAKVKSAQALVKRYVTNPKVLQFLDDSLLGNDFEVIGIVARLNEILEGARSKMKLQKKSKRETTELTKGGK